MHIPDGILPAQACIGGYAIATPVTWYCLRQINRQKDPTAQIPKASLLTAAFFVASSIHIPIPPASVHLVFNGVLGAMLGYYAFPAILIGLFFQAIIIGHGGLTTIGVNAVMMGVPALLAYHVFQLRYHVRRGRSDRWTTGIFAFLAGAVGIGVAALIFFALIITTIPSGFNATTEQAAIYGLTLAHIPLMLIEGTFTVMLALFLQRVKPELLES
ncbi:MAG: cobalt transporter CbiM [Cyanobacteria bacterium CRU_2_1]|nr:cobalt transporter CbiM [Cyanobacteria bacterium CRU_2_1]NJR58512.1 cobalt transporter CbiM [Cyanobacteria bacterium CRU_2_1]